MISRGYATDTQSKSSDIAATVLAASSPLQILAACDAVESFLHKHTADQTRWFFSITFPTLICKIFGFDESSSASAAVKSMSPSGWIDIAALSNDTQLAGRVFSLLSPTGVLLSSIVAADGLSLVKYVFPVERLPEWVRYMLQNERDSLVLSDLCPLFKNRLKEDSVKGSSFQVQLNVFEYYMFWFVYYPVCRGNSEGPQTVSVRRSRKFRLENWAYSIPGLSSTKRGMEQKNEGDLYMRLLYAYLRAYVPVADMKAHQPYRSSLLHYSFSYGTPIVEKAEFLVNTLIHFWLVDNDFSPLPVNLCKSFGMTFPFRSVVGEIPPTSGLGEVVNVFVKYLNLSSITSSDRTDQVDYTESPKWKVGGTFNASQSRNAVPFVDSGNSWNSWIQRPLYRFILRTFLYCPMESSIKNASQVFTLWVSYLEPWSISMEEFAKLDSDLGKSNRGTLKEVTPSMPHGYTSSWQVFVLANYLYYSSLVMHFIGFAHKFLHTDPEVIVKMVSKVITILASSTELMDLIKNVDIVFHSKPAGSSKSMLNALHRYVPAIREQLQDWEDGLSETDADGSFLHENWNKDLRLFSDGEDGGQKLLQLFVLRAESELQSIGGENLSQNLQGLDRLKSELCQLFGGPIMKPVSTPETVQCEYMRDEIFKPRSFANRAMVDIKYKGDWMKRPISDDEIGWLAKVLVKLSGWLNESLGLSQVESSQESPSWSYVDMSSDARSVCGPMEVIKVVLCSFISWLLMLRGAGVRFMREHGVRVNLRVLASKKVVVVLLVIAAFSLLRRAFFGVG
ncbi:hypothetical protein KY290_035433 [Solanum tuberosum]|uniref:Sphingomyelin phosphodiesterase n=1 Tax=Solanum tuberosum TaxID=4113 RepID=A0ABQ7U645_SOLTU|nr:hypothetical protein KY289_034036 [Solanum tuberosum]KAH0649481.1 hypothetical protein KY285_034729 [Solanum tuberosum]KAH0742390.1 hypothetical protein KY290_035433 [Solanum tuberosum]